MRLSVEGWYEKISPEAEERRAIGAAVRAVETFKRWRLSRTRPGQYLGAPATDVMAGLLPETPVRRQCQLLQLVLEECVADGGQGGRRQARPERPPLESPAPSISSPNHRGHHH